MASLGEPRAARVMADPAWPALVAAVNGAVGSGWTPQQLLTDIHTYNHTGEGQLLPAADLGRSPGMAGSSTDRPRTPARV